MNAEQSKITEKEIAELASKLHPEGSGKHPVDLLLSVMNFLAHAKSAKNSNNRN